MKPLYYREINFASDRFNRQGGTRSHPEFYLNDSPIVGCRYLALKNITLPTSWLNLPDDEVLAVEYSYIGLGGTYTMGIQVPAGNYDAESMGALLTAKFDESLGYAPTDMNNGPLYLPLKNFQLTQITQGKDVNKLEHGFYNVPPSTFSWRYDFFASPVTARLLGFPSDQRYSEIVPDNNGVLLGPPSRFLEPQSLWIRSTLGNGILHFGNSFTGKSNSKCADVVGKVVFNPSDTIFNGIVVFETNPTPSAENLFSFSCYTAISQFDMWLSTHPTSLYPNGREIDLQGQVFSGTLCMLCEVPS